MKSHFVGILGWYGVVAVVGSYALVSFAIIAPTGLIYQLLNFTGALGLAAETYSKKDYQPFWLNLVWSAVAVIALANILFRLKA